MKIKLDHCFLFFLVNCKHLELVTSIGLVQMNDSLLKPLYFVFLSGQLL